MTISTILDNTETSAAEKIAQLSKVVDKAKEAYGNTGIEITAPKVNSSEGYVDMKFMSAEDKIVIASIAIREITMEVAAITDIVEGVVFDSEIERAFAMSSILSNLTATQDSKYL